MSARDILRRVNTALRFDAQLLSSGQKSQAQTNLGVDPTTLNTRYARLDGNGNVALQKSDAALVLQAPDTTRVLTRLRNSTGYFDILIDAVGNLAIYNSAADGTYINNPLYIKRDGTPVFNVRPTTPAGVGYETRDAKGVANGYPALGPDGLVPSSQLPISGSYLGTWNASTNAPALTTTPAANGAFYLVSVAGTQSVTGSPAAFAVGDQLRSNGTAWQRIPSSDAVPSVFGRTGPVLAASGDYNATQVTYGATTVSAALDAKAPLASPALTGTPTAPTAALGTNTTQLATMAAIKAAADAIAAGTFDGGTL